MNNLYYSKSIMFNMRDFISKIIGKYIEHLQEDESIGQEEFENIQDAFQKFQVWLYKTTN